MLALTPLAGVDQIGTQLLEWHKVSRILRRVSDLRLAYRGRYDA